MAFSEELRRWRTRMKLTQMAAAAILGVPYRTYEGWEQGWHEPSHLNVLRKLMRQLEQEKKAS